MLESLKTGDSFDNEGNARAAGATLAMRYLTNIEYGTGLSGSDRYLGREASRVKCCFGGV